MKCMINMRKQIFQCYPLLINCVQSYLQFTKSEAMTKLHAKCKRTIITSAKYRWIYSSPLAL